MRKLTLIAALLISVVLAGNVVAASPVKDKLVKFLICGKTVSFKPAAFERGTKVYVPLEATVKATNGSVKWVKAKKAYLVTTCPGGKSTWIKGSEGVKVNGTMMVSLFEAATALNCDAKWIESDKTARLAPRSQSPSTPCPAPVGG